MSDPKEAQPEVSKSFKAHRRKQLKAIQDDIALIARDLELDPHEPLVVATIMLWYKSAERIHIKAETIRNPDLFRMEEADHEPTPKDNLRDNVDRLHDESIEVARWLGRGPDYAPAVIELLGALGVHRTFTAIRNGSGFPPEYFEAAKLRPRHRKGG